MGLRCRIPPFMSDKGLGNIFDLIPEWERTLPSFGNFSWDIYRVPPRISNIKVDI
jgi:hypothetical protein